MESEIQENYADGCDRYIYFKRALNFIILFMFLIYASPT